MRRNHVRRSGTSDARALARGSGASFDGRSSARGNHPTLWMVVVVPRRRRAGRAFCPCACAVGARVRPELRAQRSRNSQLELNHHAGRLPSMAKGRGGGSSRSSAGSGRSSGERSGSAKRSSSESTTRIVQPREEGGWEVDAPDAERVSAVEPTQRDAERRAKEIVGNAGGGEVVIKGRDGKIRDSDTVAPGHDPNPPKDKKH